MINTQLSVGYTHFTYAHMVDYRKITTSHLHILEKINIRNFLRTDLILYSLNSDRETKNN
jgi:hypothetical protein